MLKKKIILVISFLIVVGICLFGVFFFKKYSDRETENYLVSGIASVKIDIAKNELSQAQDELKSLSNKNKSINNKAIENELKALNDEIIKKQNSLSEDASLQKIDSLIKKGSLSEASFEINRLSEKDLSTTGKATLEKEKQLLKTAKANETNLTIEKNTMNTLQSLMSSGQYTQANDVIENLDTSNFSAASLSQIATYTKTIQEEQNKFNIKDFKIDSSTLTNLYKSANPSAKGIIVPAATTPVYFIGDKPIYKINILGGNPNVAYISADGVINNADVMTAALTSKNLYTIENGKKVIATELPSDMQK